MLFPLLLQWFHHRRPVDHCFNMSCVLTVLFMINVFYKQHLVSYYNKTVFEKVLFYMLHRKKTSQKTQPRHFIGRIWSSAKWIVSLPVFLIHLPFWQIVPGLQYEPVTFILIPKRIFFHYYLSVIAGSRPLSLLFISHTSTLSYSFHTSHETSLVDHVWCLCPFTMLKAKPRSQYQPPFTF